MVSLGHGATSHQPCSAELDTGVSDLDEDCDCHHRGRSSFGWISLLSGLEKALETLEHFRSTCPSVIRPTLKRRKAFIFPNEKPRHGSLRWFGPPEASLRQR